MKNPKFNNIPNQCINGIWNSRSVAVDAFIFAKANNINDGMLNVLAIHRSPSIRDEPNKWAVPSGYLDWNENGYESTIREVYEETSLYLPDYEKYMVFNNHEQSFYTDTRITNNRQNVVLRYVFLFDFGDGADFPINIEEYTCEETDIVKWIGCKEYTRKDSELIWAFDHNIKIFDAISYIDGRYDIDHFNKTMKKKISIFND